MIMFNGFVLRGFFRKVKNLGLSIVYIYIIVNLNLIWLIKDNVKGNINKKYVLFFVNCKNLIIGKVSIVY